MNIFKRSVILKVIFFLIPVIGSVVFFVYTFDVYKGSIGKKNELLNLIFEMRTRIADLHDREAVLAANLGLYKKILFLKIKQDSYMNDVSNVVNELAKKHMLINPKVQISAPKAAKFDTYNGSNSLSSVTGIVSINFLSISDINVFSFVNSVRRCIPGYVLIKEIKLIRKGDLDTKTILEYIDYKASNEVISGSVTFEWYGLESMGVGN